MRIILLIILLTINVLPNSSFAASCLMRGEWMSMMLTSPTKGTVTTKVTLGAFLFEQEGDRVWIEPTLDPACGEIRQEGTTDGSTVSMQLHMTNTENKICHIWTQVDATFSADCNHLQGNIVVHMPDADPFEMPLRWTRNLIQITNPSPTRELVISAEPKMPEINVEAIHKQPDPLAYLSSMGKLNTRTPAYTWHVDISHNTAPPRIIHHTKLTDVNTDSPSYRPNFSDLINSDDGTKVEGGIMGGELTLGVEFYNAIKDEKKYFIKGTNPGQAAIESILTTHMSRQIACQESKYKQFKGNREGGVGLPVIGKDKYNREIGGVGIMQIYKQENLTTPGEVWNWRLNLKAGLEKINDSRTGAEKLHTRETNRLNKERLALGIPACPPNAITKLTQEQIERETIRRYNCGREYRWEPRDAPNCEGKWVYDLSCKREGKEGYEADYVNKTLLCNINN